MKIIHCTPNMETVSPRILRALETHARLHCNFGWSAANFIPGDHPRLIDGNRSYSFFRDILSSGLSIASEGDAVVFTADDTILPLAADEAIRAFTPRVPCFSGQRVELEFFSGDIPDLTQAQKSSTHMGRCLLGFTFAWLKDHLEQIPNFVIGAEAVDICMSAMIRKSNGRPWTIETAAHHDEVCELPLGCVLHEPHESSWLKQAGGSVLGNQWNLILAKKWFQENLPDSMPAFMKDV